MQETGKSKIVGYLLGVGVDVNKSNENDETALMIASGAGHLEVCEQLIQAKAELDKKDTDGDPAVIWVRRTCSSFTCRFREQGFVRSGVIRALDGT